MADPVSAKDYAAPPLKCDLILKGGITSGVVFPKAIGQLARKYRFVNLGGTSAGAIGAVMAAAAEYRRQTAEGDEEKGTGFVLIEGIPQELGGSLRGLFQPSRRLGPILKIGEAVFQAAGSKLTAFLIATLLAFPRTTLLAVLPGVAITVHQLFYGDLKGVLLGVVVTVFILAIALFTVLWARLTVDLPKEDFGVCPGLRQSGQSKAAFTDWMADKIDAVAGLNGGAGGGRPLTIGDLRRHGINLAAMTTDLASQRPYQLPFGDQIHHFRKSEFERLFPGRIVAHLTAHGEPVSAPGGPADLYRLPPRDEMPVVVVARMSLSFPGLISAVPLYRHDQTLKEGRRTFRRCLFSDGGITSNFPIHFFDGLLPGQPTFGISLGSYDRARDGGDPLNPGDRVFLPEGALKRENLAVHEVSSLSGFAGAILDTARNWQDNLQSALNGYRERIVEIRLDDAKEGGLNLDMSKTTIDFLADLGDIAGAEVRDRFDFNAHRRLRAVTAIPVIADALGMLGDRYFRPSDGHVLSYAHILGNLHIDMPQEFDAQEAQKLADLARRLADLGHALLADPVKVASRQRANLRIVASTDTNPPAHAAPVLPRK